MHGPHVPVCTPYNIWKCSWQTIPLGSPPRPGLAHQSAPGQSVVLCSGGSTTHNVPEVLGCLHPGPAATFQPHEAERCHAPGKTQGPVQQSDRISFWYLRLAGGLCGPPRIVLELWQWSSCPRTQGSEQIMLLGCCSSTPPLPLLVSPGVSCTILTLLLQTWLLSLIWESLYICFDHIFSHQWRVYLVRPQEVTVLFC